MNPLIINFKVTYFHCELQLCTSKKGKIKELYNYLIFTKFIKNFQLERGNGNSREAVCLYKKNNNNNNWKTKLGNNSYCPLLQVLKLFLKKKTNLIFLPQVKRKDEVYLFPTFDPLKQLLTESWQNANFISLAHNTAENKRSVTGRKVTKVPYLMQKIHLPMHFI